LTNIAITIIWALFFFIFFILGIYHFIQSRKEYPLFKIEVDVMGGVSFFNTTATANEKRIEIFLKEFNEYISKYNTHSKEANKAACYGYFVSLIVCIVSLLLEMQFI
jgi:hypothetical protein